MPHTVSRIVTDQAQAEPIPEYTVVAGRFYRTVHHARGWSDTPDYEIRSDGLIYRCPTHPLGPGQHADYRIGPDCGLYRTACHPDGISDRPEYLLHEIAH